MSDFIPLMSDQLERHQYRVEHTHYLLKQVATSNRYSGE